MILVVCRDFRLSTVIFCITAVKISAIFVISAFERSMMIIIIIKKDKFNLPSASLKDRLQRQQKQYKKIQRGMMYQNSIM